MALALYDRVQETGTANTTVSFTLSGAVAGFQSFSVIGNGNTTYYSATDSSGNWEVGLGTYSTTGPTLTRTTIYSSSNAGSAVTFSGTVTVFVTQPATNTIVSSNNPGTSGYVLTSGGSGVAPTWAAAAGGGASVTVSSTAPSSPSAGDLWWDDVGGRLKIYYTDANTSQWIDSTVNSSTTGAVYDTQTFTSSGTWTKPVGVNNVRVVAIGGGGGGGSGRKGAVSSTRLGGAGGLMGAYIDKTLQATDLTSTVTVTIGTGGTGGASQTTNSTNGNDGIAGGNTTFGTYFTSYGGFAGGAGNNTSSTTYVVTTKVGMESASPAFATDSTGGIFTTSISTQTGVSFSSQSRGGAYGIFGAGGGAGGGSITSTNIISTVLGYGGIGAFVINGGFAGGTASIVDGTAGGNGTASTTNSIYGGGGGGAGQASLLTNGGAGGAGALYGGGGGGGGASVDSVGNSGAGGNGADGIIVVISW